MADIRYMNIGSLQYHALCYVSHCYSCLHRRSLFLFQRPTLCLSPRKHALKTSYHKQLANQKHKITPTNANALLQVKAKHCDASMPLKGYTQSSRISQFSSFITFPGTSRQNPFTPSFQKFVNQQHHVRHDEADHKERKEFCSVLNPQL